MKRKETFGDETPLILPQTGLEAGTARWDNAEVEIAQIDGCEAEHTLTFHFPEAGLIIVQDLMFNNAHSFPLGNHAKWISTLETIRGTEELRLVGCGHGLPAIPAAMTDAIAYLKVHKEVLVIENSAESAISSLIEQFPGYEGEGALRFISNLYQ